MLYRDFIEEASRCHIDALQHHEVSDGTPGLVALYAKLYWTPALSSKLVGGGPSTSPRRSWIPIWSRTRASASCGTWRNPDRSTYCANSVRPAACSTAGFATALRDAREGSSSA